MTYEQFYLWIKSRQNNGESIRALAREFEISAPAMGRLCKGKKPTPDMRRKLKLDPSPKLQYTQERRKMLDKIAIYWKYKNWSDYETKTIEDFENNFDKETKEWTDKYTECAVCHLPIQEHQNGSKMNHEYKEIRN